MLVIYQNYTEMHGQKSKIIQLVFGNTKTKGTNWVLPRSACDITRKLCQIIP